MAKTYNRLELDVNRKPTDIITAVQADSNSRYLDVSLFNNGVPLDLRGHEVKIFMVKPENGGEIWNDGVITDAAAGRCEFLMTTEALARMGHLQTQISVWKDNTEILSTQIFQIYVTKSLLGESAVEASNEYGTLVLLFQNLYEAYALMTEMVRNIGFPAEIAAQRDIDTMWQAWEYLIANSSVAGVLEKLGSAGDTGNSTVFGKENILINTANTIVSNTQTNPIHYSTASSNVVWTAINKETAYYGSNSSTDANTVYLYLNHKMAGVVRVTMSVKATSCTGSTSSYTVAPVIIVMGDLGRANLWNVAPAFTYSGTTYKTFTTDIYVRPTDYAIGIRFSSGNFSSSNIYHCNLLTLCGTLTPLKTSFFSGA